MSISFLKRTHTNLMAHEYSCLLQRGCSSYASSDVNEKTLKWIRFLGVHNNPKSALKTADSLIVHAYYSRPRLRILSCAQHRPTSPLPLEAGPYSIDHGIRYRLKDVSAIVLASDMLKTALPVDDPGHSYQRAKLSQGIG